MAIGFFALLDDIALLADDIAIATQNATVKTTAILGDDLAVSAQKATGFKQDRELKVIWAIVKGSLLNKLIILPIAFLLSAFYPFIIPYILIAGGLYLLYEGVEKIIEYFFLKHSDNEELKQTNKDDVVEFEKAKIKSAIFTDFILSIEIVILALNTVLEEPLIVQIISTSFVALAATFGVYGIVALIIRIDNVGFWFIKKDKVSFGNFLIALVPKIIKTLTVIGTIAMVLVGGGILVHNIDFVHHYFIIESLPFILNEFIIGIAIGLIVFFIVSILQKFKTKS